MSERMRVTSFIAVGCRGPTVPRSGWAPEPRRSDRLAARPGTAWSPQDYPRAMRGDRPAHRSIGARAAQKDALGVRWSRHLAECQESERVNIGFPARDDRRVPRAARSLTGY